MSHKPKRIPTQDSEWNGYQQGVYNYLNGLSPDGVTPNWQRLGVTVTEQGTLYTYTVNWSTVYPKTLDRSQRTSALTEQKNDIREVYKAFLRELLNHIEESPNIIPDDRQTLHIFERDVHPTPTPAPGIAPDVTMDKIVHLVHTLRFRDPDSPETKEKPHGVASIEVYRLVLSQATLPAGTAEDSFLHIGSTGKFLFTVEYMSPDVGKTAFYVVRYKSTRGDFGPWSTVASAMIA